MDLTKLNLKEKDVAELQTLMESGKTAMQKRLNELMQVHPALKVMEPTLPNWMEVVNLLIIQSYLRGQAVTIASQSERLSEMARLRDVAMEIAEEGIVARERIFGKDRRKDGERSDETGGVSGAG